MKGVDRIRYLYEVSESGRPEVNMTTQGTIRSEVIERTKTSYLGPSIVKLDLGVDHFFQDTDGKCLLWLEMSKRDFEGLEFENPRKAKDAMNVTLVKASSPAEDAAARKAMVEQINAEQAQCPRKINDYTTLKKVFLKGNNRIKYLYLVTDEGLPHVNMDMEDEVSRQVIERTKDTPLGKSIVKLDLGVEHFFQDTQGRCMLWLQMTKKDFLGEQAAPEPEEVAEAEPEPEEEGPSAVTRLKSLLPEKFRDTVRSQVNPAGVQDNPYVK
jgi:hypothetical protein